MADQPTPAKWTMTTTADNAAATVTKAAETDTLKAHYVTGVHGSFSAAIAGKLMTLKDGSTVIGNFHVHNQRDVLFARPVRITPGAAVELSLAASGAGGTIGAVTLTGFTLVG